MISLHRFRVKLRIKPSRLLIYEPDHHGHRLEYVRQICLAARKNSWRPEVCVTEKAERSAQWAVQLQRLAVDGDIKVRRLPPRLLGNRSFFRRNVALVVPDADRRPIFVLVASCIGTGQVIALLMRPPDRRTRKGRRKYVLWNLIGRAPRLTIYALGDCLGELEVPRDPRWRVVSDTPHIYSTCPQESKEPIDERKVTILIAGVIDARKAPNEIAAAALLHPSMNVRIAGKIADGIDIDDSAEAISVRNEFLSNEDLDREISCADVVSVVLRSQSGSSGIYGRALRHGKPVLAGGNATVVRSVIAHQTGAVASEVTTSALAEAMNELLVSRELFAEAVERAARTMNSLGTLGEALLETLSLETAARVPAR